MHPQRVLAPVERTREQRTCCVNESMNAEFRHHQRTEEPAEPEDGTISVTFSSWIMFTSDSEIPVRPDWIVTIVEPVNDIKKMYEEKVNGTECEVSSFED